MKIYLISMMNAFVLMTFGLWGYLASETPSLTSLIPVFAGALLLTFVEKLRYGSKSFLRLSLIFTALILIALVKPLTDALSLSDSNAIYRIGFMMVLCAITVGFFVRKYIKVNKKRAKVNG
jgi:hypothetical protein